MSLNFFLIRSCPGKNIACEKIRSEQESPQLNIMSVEENFDCKRKRLLICSLDSQNVNKSGWIRQGEEEALP